MTVVVNQTLQEREWQTRKQRIDPRLRKSGWTILSFRTGLDLASRAALAIAEYPTEVGPADYALVLDGQVVGIIEAKRLSLGPQNVLTQAERLRAAYPAAVSISTGCELRSFIPPMAR